MRALVLVDIQNDFMPGGALPVTDGWDVVPVANRLLARFDRVVATQDWHPADHGSFASQHGGRTPGEVVDLHGLPQVLWPDHCVQGLSGASFASALDVGGVHRVFRKGADVRVDSYSGFFDNGKQNDTGMGAWLRAEAVTDLFVLGLATDYCVKFTALDAAALGFRTHLVLDGCRGVELAAGDVDAAVAAMREAGVVVTSSGAIP